MDTARAIFLSYGRRDAKALADRLETDLKARGYTVWRDINSLKGAEGWDHQVERAIAECDVLLAVLSPHAMRGAGPQAVGSSDSVCLDEIAYARFGPKPVPIVPIMGVATPPPLLLIRQQFLDFVGAESSPEYGAKFTVLVDLIDSVISTGATPAPGGSETEIFDLDYLIPGNGRGVVGREWLQQNLVQWIEQPAAKRVLLLTGDPGIGKSTFFANFVSHNPGGHVAAYHACRLTRADTLAPDRAIRSMALMLARADDGCRARLAALSRDKEPLAPAEAQANPQRAFDEGLLRLLRDDNSGATRVLFIDSLDESLFAQGPNLAGVIANAIGILPANLRIVATTRSTPAVMNLFSGQPTLTIDAGGQQNLDDLRAYVAQRLGALPAASDGKVAERVEALAAGNFLAAQLLVDEVAETGAAPVAADAPGIAGEYTRGFRRRFASDAAYEPIRTALGVTVAALAPLPLDIAVAACGASNKRAFVSMIEPVASCILRKDHTLSPFHLSFAEWLQDHTNSYGADVPDGHRRIAKTFAARAAAAEALPASDHAYYSRHLLDHTALGGAVLDKETPIAVYAALQLGTASRGQGFSWPRTDKFAPEFTRYVEALCRTRNADAAAFLLEILNEAILQDYVEGGLLQPLPPGASARFNLTNQATQGGAIARAFQNAGEMGAIIRALCAARVFESAPASAAVALNVAARHRYYAGGFDVAGWGSSISGYFEDAGTSLNRDLNEIVSLVEAYAPKANG